MRHTAGLLHKEVEDLADVCMESSSEVDNIDVVNYMLLAME